MSATDLYYNSIGGERERDEASMISTSLSHATSTLLVLLILPQLIKSQPQQNLSSTPGDPAPYMGLIFLIFIVLTIMAMLFYYFLRERHLYESPYQDRNAAALMLSIHRPNSPPHGLDPVLVKTFPILTYSEAKDLLKRAGRPELECAVCLNPFQGANEKLRLLPKCNHVFHRQCVDPWLACHTTCPYCRANLLPEPGRSTQRGDLRAQIGSGERMRLERDAVPAVPADDVVVVTVEDQGASESRAWRVEGSEIEGTSSFQKLRRSHSTGHEAQGEREDGRRITVSSPEEVRNDDGTLHRATSYNTLPFNVRHNDV